MLKKYFEWLKRLYEKPAIESDERLWITFLSARIALALTLVFIQILLYLLQDPWAAIENILTNFLYVVIYLIEAITVLWFFKQTQIFKKPPVAALATYAGARFSGFLLALLGQL